MSAAAPEQAPTRPRRRFPVTRRPGGADEESTIERAAAVAEQLATLLSAGVGVAAAWSHLDPASDPAAGRRTDAGGGALTDPIAAAAAAAREGLPVHDALRRSESSGPWRALAAAWEIAAACGAPLAGSLRELSTALRDEAQLRREVRTALAGPNASARLVAWLPVIAIGFGLVLGFDTLGVLLGSPLGLGCLLAGTALLWAGRRWNRALAARASRGSADAGLEYDLLAIALTGGVSLDRARTLVATALSDGDGPTGTIEIDRIVGLAAAAGAPVAELLRAEAFRVRRAARAQGIARAAALGVRLMIPLGVCVLPAFVLLGVAPLVISVVSGTFSGAG
ncbi:type II secretion system F family protein [Agromyces mediolanus]|uniref:type II secretion system F family protein n=1 Tax=Agromyces mediolanus TaxID=41986 RepID=UPI00204113AE|nr:type II secretion system F family protein [Agromyces mediolanus]MCM3656034.1 type II secretion system F family protein [Agromyces mediolanus]